MTLLTTLAPLMLLIHLAVTSIAVLTVILAWSAGELHGTTTRIQLDYEPEDHGRVHWAFDLCPCFLCGDAIASDPAHPAGLFCDDCTTELDGEALTQLLEATDCQRCGCLAHDGLCDACLSND